MKKIQISLVLIIISITIFSIVILQNKNQEKNNEFFKFEINIDKNDLEEIESDSLFKVSGLKGDYTVENNKRTWLKLFFELKDENKDLYKKLRNDGKQNTVIIYPIFTGSAYEEPGFYNYYKSECDFSCLTVPIKTVLRTEMGGNAIQILKLLDYDFLSDVQIDKNPELLENYDKVILLHNEYVTKNQFTAITNQPKVVYLYPNVLYAEVQPNYDKNTITLVRGHGYPEETIANGFDWEFENTNPYEYDIKCDNWEFYEITNGYMLNCYPEAIIFVDEELLRKIKEI